MGGIYKTGFSLAVPVCLGAVVTLSGCYTEPVIDLARNEYIYRSTNYKAPRSTPGPAYVTRLRDRRTLPDVNTGASYRKIFSEGVWDRKVPVMVEELLVDEIGKSGIYNGLSSGTAARPAPSDYLIEPTLKEMYRMREVMAGSGMTGRRRTVAVAALQVKVRGPVDRVGNRPVLLDETFRELVATEPTLAKPEEGIALAGLALQRILSKALAKMYESNIATETGESSESSGIGEGGKPADAGATQPKRQTSKKQTSKKQTSKH